MQSENRLLCFVKGLGATLEWAMAGATDVHQFIVIGTMAGKQVRCLIDSGASISFVSKDIVSELDLKMKTDQRLSVTLGNSTKEQVNTSVFEKIYLGDDLDFQVRMFCMDLPSGCDIVIGMDFLVANHVLADFEFKRLSVRRDADGQRHVVAVGQARNDGDDDDTQLSALPDDIKDVQLGLYSTTHSDISDHQNVSTKAK